MGATFAFGWFALFPDEFKQLGKHIAGGAGFLANFMFWAEVGYFDTAAETKPLLHLWSLGIEEQFYIAWPVLLLLAWQRRLNLLAVTVILALLSFAINVAFIRLHASAVFYSPATRAWELLLGAVLASATLKADGLPAWRDGWARRLSPNLVSAAGFALLALGLATITRERQFPGWLALLPVLGAVLIIGAGPRAWLNRTVLSNRLLVGVGLISYPLYLWHWPLLSFAQIVESHTPAPAIRAAAVGAAFVLAWLTYRLVERPLRFGAGRDKVAILATLMVALAIAGGYAYDKKGLPERAAIVANRQHQQALVLVEDVKNAAACKLRYGFASLYEYCLMAKVGQDPTVALVGDSHAYHVSAGLLKYYSAQGENLLFLGTRLPFWGLPPSEDGYQKATQRMLDIALETPTVKTVLFSTALHFSRGSPLAISYIDAARETLRRFTLAGKQVIYLEDVPFLDFEPRACIKRAGVASSTTKLPCAMPRAAVERAIAEHNRVLAGLLAEFPSVQLFRTIPYMCDAQWCRATIDGKLMYRDTNHLSYDGDLYIGEKFAQAQQANRAQAPRNTLK